MSTNDDAGRQAIEQIFAQLQIDAEWSIRDERSVTWWGKDHAQTVAASEPVEDRGCKVCRLLAITDVFREVPDTIATYRALAAGNGYGGTLSALVYNPYNKAIFLAATATVHEQTLPHVAKLFAMTAAMQAADAQIKGDNLASVFGGLADRSEHPENGARPDMDDMLNVIAAVVAPVGQQSSRWAGAEMQTALAWLQPISMAAVGSDEGVGAEFPFHLASSLLQLDTTPRHPQVGSGLLASLSLPWNGDSDEFCRVANQLNLLELATVPLSNLRGAWCVSPSKAVAFKAFYPSILCQRDASVNLAMQMAVRAEWVATMNDKRTREERWRAARPAVFRLLADDPEANPWGGLG